MAERVARSWDVPDPDGAARSTASVMIAPRLPRQRGHLLGDVDAGRAPRDAPSTSDAPGAAELVVPGAELVGQPVPVSGLSRVTHRSLVMEIMTFGRHYRGVGVANTSILMMTLTTLIFHLNAN